jgi:glycosyltransferase involved in cell wall biosynthesis
VKTLYLCYFGLREPLVQTQVLPYLRELAAADLQVFLLTFEPHMRARWSAQDFADEKARLSHQGIQWSALPYHKSPSVPATLFDVVAGWVAAVRLAHRHGIQVLHARAHIPMAMALMAARITRSALIFDIRGLMADEYVDAGVWTENSLIFRAIKKLEKIGIVQADQLVVLTEAMKRWLLGQGLLRKDNVEVIPCCVDFHRYTHAASATDDVFEVVYAGSVTGLYLLEEMATFFLQLKKREPRSFFRILTTSSAIEAGERLVRAGLRPQDFWIGSVSPQQVPSYLERASLGLSFRKPTFSQIAASPTKIAEYLAAGLPIVSNAGVGDIDELLELNSVGVLVRDFTATELARAADAALALANDARTRTRCVEVGRVHFDLQTVGGSRYRNVYRRVANDCKRQAAEDSVVK